MVRKTAVSFTGGKDSTLTIHLLSQPPKDCDEDLTKRMAPCSGCEVCLLVTFVPAGAVPDFKAHSLDIIKLQAEAMNIKHVTMEINAPYLESYNQAIRNLKEEYGITVLATGDMMDVSNGFMPKAVAGTGVELLTPLWEMDRQKVLDLVWHYKMHSLVTCINISKFASSENQSKAGECTAVSSAAPPAESNFQAEDLLGQTLSQELVERVLHPAKIQYGVDECGEKGEYHTMTCDSSIFSQKLQLEYEPSEEGVYRFLRMESVRLVKK